MDNLPLDVYFEIFKHLDDVDLLQIPQLCHYFNDLMKTRHFWNNRISRWFYNMQNKPQAMSKKRYIGILRSWQTPSKPTIATVYASTADCLCRYHIYDGEVFLPCKEYIPLEALDYPSYEPKLYVPLQFWFNRNPALALPLVARQPIQIDVPNSDFIDEMVDNLELT